MVAAGTDPYQARVPFGSLQAKTLRHVVDRLDPEFRRPWWEWALAQEWPLDPGFKRALHAVAAQEGFV